MIMCETKGTLSSWYGESSLTHKVPSHFQVLLCMYWIGTFPHSEIQDVRSHG